MNNIISQFVPKSQLSHIEMVISKGSSDTEFFKRKLADLEDTILTMPKTYETDGQGSDALVVLKYFSSSADWFITEKDVGTEQLQAFGYTDLGNGMAELGYISIKDLVESGEVNIDMFWEPKPLGDALKIHKLNMAHDGPF